MSHEHTISVKFYFGIFISLLALLIITVVAGYIDLGNFNLPIAMLIATIKAILIVLYFMHVRFSSRFIALFFGASIYVLLLGAILMFSDYLYRV